jgi:hypothetical protein
MQKYILNYLEGTFPILNKSLKTKRLKLNLTRIILILGGKKQHSTPILCLKTGIEHQKVSLKR